MPGVAVDTVPALSSPDAGAALSSPADSATDAFVEDLMQSPGEWTAWDFAPLWSPGPLEPVQRLRYWYGATTRYVQRMSKASNARYNPGSLDEFDVEGAAADCLDLMIAFIATLAKIGSPYVSFIDSKRNVAW